MKKCFFLALSLCFATIVNAQLSGTYTINSNSSQNPDYTSFSAAVSALSAGVSDQVIFQVAPGTYEEYVTINEITGANATNRVIFRGMGADNQQVVVTSNAGYTDNSTLKLNGTDYVTFENMTVTTTSTGRARLLVFDGQCDYNRFENVRFIGVEVTNNNTDNDKNLVHMNNGDGIVNHDTQFVGCQFVNGCVALYLQGKNMTLFNEGVLVENCTFENQQFKSIYLMFYNNVILRGNTIANANDYKTDYNAIDIFQCYNGAVIENNVMNVIRTTAYATVFRIRPLVGTADNHVIIRNNIVNLQANSNSYAFAIYYNECAYIDFAHNTLKCTGSGENINIFVEKNGTNFNFYNNLLVNNTKGYVFRFNSNIDSRLCDYNRIHFSGNNVGSFTTNDYATLSDWTAATGFDTHSTICTPNFVGANDLHITDATGLTVANPLSYVTKDIDNQDRSTTAPCAGADELTSGVDLPPVVANQLAPINFTSYPQTLNFDLSNTFDDPDNNNDFIEITVQNCPSEITAAIDDEDMLSVSRTTSNAFSNKTLVIRATSNGKHVDMNVSVSGSDVTVTVETATFDDVTLGTNGYWQGQDGNNEMFSGGWLFTNYYSSTYSFWGGFTASNHTDMSQSGLNAQYTAASGAGYDGSAQYGVAYAMGTQTDVYASDGQLHTVTGCYVTNNLWAYQNMHDGDATATPFGGTSGNDPDWFKLTATGKNANGQTVGTAEFYLADYRFDNSEDDYILNTWEWFDLSTLGAVHTVSFSLSSSKNNQYGMITPAYFCMDNFNGTAPTPPTPPQDLPPYIVNPVDDVVFTDFPETIEVNLDGVATDDDNDDEQIVYTIVSNSNETELSAQIEAKTLIMNRVSREEAVADLVLRATSNGLYVDFNVHVVINFVPDGIEDNEMEMISVYPNPAHDFIRVETQSIASVLGVEIYNVTGQKVLLSKDTEINVSTLPEGVYFVVVFTENQRIVERIVIQ